MSPQTNLSPDPPDQHNKPNELKVYVQLPYWFLLDIKEIEKPDTFDYLLRGFFDNIEHIRDIKMSENAQRYILGIGDEEEFPIPFSERDTEPIWLNREEMVPDFDKMDHKLLYVGEDDDDDYADKKKAAERIQLDAMEKDDEDARV